MLLIIKSNISAALHNLGGGNTLILKDESLFKNDLISAQHSAALCQRNLVDDRIESE